VRTAFLHTESAVTSPNTLGQSFTEWDVALDAGCVGDYCAPETTIEVFVDGEPTKEISRISNWWIGVRSRSSWARHPRRCHPISISSATDRS
jgi:hypothetical protein